MPARDRSGPLGQGSRTGRGMGNCVSDKTNTPQPMIPGERNKPFGWGGRVWDATFGRFFGRRRANRINRR
jgi:hypothetical protein